MAGGSWHDKRLASARLRSQGLQARPLRARRMLGARGGGACLDAVLREQAQRAAQVCHPVALHARPVSDQLPLTTRGSGPVA